jgi:hypothetical protein
VRRAVSDGITCETVTDRLRVADEILKVDSRERAELWQGALARREVTLMVARDKHGTPRAWTGVVLDESVCLITLTGSTSKEARWALHDYLVRILIARGVRYLLANGGGPFGALGYTANIQHYQHLLGYELRHLVPVSPANARQESSLACLATASADRTVD